ncbi:CoA ester lyase [Microbispora sp. SCL1-1]|uniref:HpcH/HpaI aldolase/citrate lyase family protein n=1 Tax=unclassified Microbispora TaxID=2614687 RepID=UPI00115C2A83|nr:MULTISPECIES: CoA ester lyase [unclassified Microbispora]NJP25294.1 CoA ester lyase [Microbispora sp. CL1-1]TQS13742.1 CoA ester lyase [Microbispora sp. SCL1-1]
MTGAYGTTARTLLFVPGTRPDRFAKAAASGADAVVIDLEDAVAPLDKARARAAAAAHVSVHPALVRVNGIGTPWHADDLAALAGTEGLAGVVLPKTEAAEHVASVAAALGPRVPVFALLESARGVRDADLIAQAPGVARLLFGNLDFCLDMGIPSRGGDEQALLFARSKVVLAARAAGLPGPVDGVEPEIDDDAAALEAARRAAAMGFTGKLCLHPRQVAVVRGAFSPSDAELNWARRVLDAAAGSAGAAVRVDGEMIDRPRLEFARRIVDSAGEKPA